MSLPAILGMALATRTPMDGRPVEVLVGNYGPKIEIRYARPTLKWEVWPANPFDRFQGVEMSIDGKSVPAVYDEDQRALQYTPDKPLSAGTHRVECHVFMPKGIRFDQAWESKISSDAASVLPAPVASQVEALAAINAIRKPLALPAMVSDDRMNAAALQHSRYLAKNKDFGHKEDPAKDGYSGSNASDRLAAYGWVGGCWEDVSYGTPNAAEAVKGLFDAPYHRVPFLQPGVIACGAGFADQRLTLEFGTARQEETVVSPADGQTDIPTRWRNFERPDPLRMHRQSDGVTGYPIVLAQFGGRGQRLGTVLKARLFDSDGQEVPTWLNTPENDENLTNAAVLIPQRALKAKTTYQYSFAVKGPDGRTVNTSGIFTTGK